LWDLGRAAQQDTRHALSQKETMADMAFALWVILPEPHTRGAIRFTRANRIRRRMSEVRL